MAEHNVPLSAGATLLLAVLACRAPEVAPAPPPRGPQHGIDDAVVAAVAAAERAPGDGRGLAAATRGPVPGAWLAGIRFDSLAQAVEQAPADARIELEEGRHAAQLDVQRSLRLLPRVAGAEVVLESTTPVVLRVRSGARVVCEALTLRGTGARRPGGEATVIVTGGRLELDRCRVEARRAAAVHVLDGDLVVRGGTAVTEGWQVCALLGQGSKARLSDWLLENRARPGTALEVWQSEVTLAGVAARADGGGLVAGPGSVVRGDGCSFAGRTAAWVHAGGDLALLDSELTGGAVGLRAQGRAALERCRLVRNGTALLVQGKKARVRLLDSALLRNDTRLVLEGAEARQVEIVEGAGR